MPAKKAAKKAPAKNAVAKKAAVKATATPSPPPLADWTLLIYLAGDNDLDHFGTDDLHEMKKIGSSDRLHLVAQRDTATRGMPTCRYRLCHGTMLDDDVVEALGETNTGDPEVLKDFLEWGLKTYPAKRTMVVLWNHGSGWDDRDIYEEARRRNLNPPEPTPPAEGNAQPPGIALPRAWAMKRGGARHRNRGSFFITAFDFESNGAQRRAIAYDDDAQDFLDSVELKQVFESVTATAGRKLEIIGMDACLMSMVEVGMQVKDAAHLFCGSQEIEPPQGWPYEPILKALADDPSMDGRSLCEIIVQEFVASYDISKPVTQSAFALSRLKALQESVDELGGFLAKGYAYQDDAVISAVDRSSRKAQRYDTADYADLGDFCERLAKVLPSAAGFCTEVQDALAACVFSSSSPHQSVKNSRGLSIYLPVGKVSPLYGKLESAQGGWGKFLRAKEF